MSHIQIGTISDANKMTLEVLLQLHNLPHKLDRFVNGENQVGYRIIVEKNHETYFRDVISPEYRAALKANPTFVQQAGRADRCQATA